MLRALALASLLASTTIAPLTPHELVDKSDLVARVVVRSHESAWVGKKILTFYEVDVVGAPWLSRSGAGLPAPLVTPAVVGAANAVIHARVAFPGGVVGDIGQSVAGTPVLVDGGEYVLCLSRPVGPRDARAPIGLWQGVWAIDASGAIRAFTHADAAPAGGVVGARDVDALRAALVPR